MIVEINGTEFQNKGAHLMLLSILDGYRKIQPDVKFTLRPGSIATYDNFMPLGIYPKAFSDIRNLRFGRLTNLLPEEFFRRYGWIKDEQVNVLLDASGFAYSSEWGESRTQRMAKECVARKKFNTKIIFLPQAFGPFNTRKIIRNINIIIQHADLIYAREKESYNHLMSIAKIGIEKIRLSPDFTCIISGKLPENYTPQGDACLIPNIRMIDRTEISREDYVLFFIKLINLLQENGYKPFFLIHSIIEDNSIANEVNQKLKGQLPVLIESDPLNIKGIIGKSKFLFSSRFHGLVSGLVQGIPTFGTGWSHKYKLLFNDFAFPQGMLDINNPCLEELFSNERKAKLVILLKRHADQYKKKADEMWNEIAEVVSS